MKRLFFYALCLAFGIVSAAKADTLPDPKDALHALAKVAGMDDYGRYEEFLASLGFSYSNLQSHLMTASGTGAVLGTRVDMNVTTSTKTMLARGTKNVEYSIFLFSPKKTARVIFWLELDTNAICIPRDQFVSAFGPLRMVFATDAGSWHLEREFSGPNHRYISAYFSEAECATKIYLTQMP
jgi:hypothetical protein